MLDMKLPSVGVFNAAPGSYADPATVARRILSFMRGADGLSFSGRRVLLNPNSYWLLRPEYAALVVGLATALRRRGATVLPLSGELGSRLLAGPKLPPRLASPSRRQNSHLKLRGHIYELPGLASGTDLLVNIAGLFSEPRAQLAGAIYNTMSLISGRRTDRSFLADLDSRLFNTTLVDIAARITPDLNIVYLPHDPGSAIRGGFAPAQCLVSSDIVAVDTLAATLAGYEPQQIPAIRLAAESGLGIGWIEAIRVDGDYPRQMRLKPLSRAVEDGRANWPEEMSIPLAGSHRHRSLIGFPRTGGRPVSVTYCAGSISPHSLQAVAACVGEVRCDRCPRCLGKCPVMVN